MMAYSILTTWYHWFLHFHDFVESMMIQDSDNETVILVSPKFGISQINSLRNTLVSFKFTLLFKQHTTVSFT